MLRNVVNDGCRKEQNGKHVKPFLYSCKLVISFTQFHSASLS